MDKRKQFWRQATWAGIATVLVPLLWVATVVGLEQTGHQGVALGIAWLTVFPLLLAVPAGIIGTIILILRASKTPPGGEEAGRG